jgi:serpin B
MVILLPLSPDGLAALEGDLTFENLERWFSVLSEVQMDVVLPRFKMETKYTLNETLATMGMPSAFTPSADFSSMTDDPEWFIHIVVHQAFVEVNEEGTEAAAATGVSGGVTSVPPSFVANHPFVFLIRDQVTNSILFLGRVIDPRG